MGVISPFEKEEYVYSCKICGKNKWFAWWHSIYKCDNCGNYNCTESWPCEKCPRRSTECLLIDQKVKDLL